MGELSPEIIAALKRDLARCDEDRRTIAAATGRDEPDSEWCAVIRLDRFRLALAALEEREAFRAEAERQSRCRTVFMDHPASWTHLDDVRRATEEPHRYGAEFRRRILAHEELCDGCRWRALLDGIRPVPREAEEVERG